VAHQPRNYQVLRDDHARAIDAQIQPQEQKEALEQQLSAVEHEPTPEQTAGTQQGQSQSTEIIRPTGGPMTGRMDEHHGWANEYNKQANKEYFAWQATNGVERNQDQLDNNPTNAEQSAATSQLDQYIDRSERGDGPQGLGNEAGGSNLQQHIDAVERGDGHAGQTVGAEDSQLQQYIDGGDRVSGQDGPSQETQDSKLQQYIDGVEPSDRPIDTPFRETAQEVTQSIDL
jgi:hypothetical protein